jgi:hypothetical protein
MTTQTDLLEELEKRILSDKQTIERTYGYSKGHARCLIILRELKKEVEEPR